MTRSLADGRLALDEPRPGVARLTIVNPAKRNALDQAMLDAIAELVGDGLDARCLMVTGSEGVFSAGYDLGGLAGSDPARAEALVAHPFAAALRALAEFDAPVLGALNGHAIAGGLELALSCDLRIAAAGAKLGMPPAKLGLVYSHTGLRTFVQTIGVPRTRELFLTGENIDADTALEWGLVNRVVADDSLQERACDLAESLAARAPLAQRGNKRAIAALADAAGRLDAEVERELLQERRASFASEDFREGVRAFAGKRAPRWRGR